MKAIGIFILIFGLIFGFNSVYAQNVPKDYEPAPYAGPPEGSGGFFNLVGSCAQGSKPVSAATYLPVTGIITKIEGGGSGFTIVRIEKDKEKAVLSVDSPSEAEGKQLLPGNYKVYPKLPSFGDETLGGSQVVVEIYIVAEQPENPVGQTER